MAELSANNRASGSLGRRVLRWTAVTVAALVALVIVALLALQTPGSPAAEEDLHRAHVPSYLEAVRRAPDTGDDPAHGLGTDDNPVFHGMHEASCLVCGGSLLAAR